MKNICNAMRNINVLSLGNLRGKKKNSHLKTGPKYTFPGILFRLLHSKQKIVKEMNK